MPSPGAPRVGNKEIEGFNVEFFRNPNIDFLGKKWFFLVLSLVLSVGCILSMVFWHHIPLGIDFRGGTQVRVKFAEAPNLDKIRAELDKAGLKDPRIQPMLPVTNHEVLISLQESETSELSLDKGKDAIVKALSA